MDTGRFEPIETILRRHGAETARQRLFDWVPGSMQRLERLHEALEAPMWGATRIHAVSLDPVVAGGACLQLDDRRLSLLEY